MSNNNTVEIVSSNNGNVTNENNNLNDNKAVAVNDTVVNVEDNDTIHVNVVVNVEDEKDEKEVKKERKCTCEHCPYKEPETEEEKSNRYFERLVEDVTEILNDGELTPLNILSACLHLMRLVEQSENLTGMEKKEMVINVLEDYAKKHNSDNMILSILPDFIDKSVELDRGDLTINPDPVTTSALCFASCLSCFTWKKNNDKKKNEKKVQK